MGISSFCSRSITLYRSFSVARRRKTLQICAAMVKFTLYSYLVSFFSMTAQLTSISVMLYAIRFAHISCLTYSGALAAVKSTKKQPYFYYKYLDLKNIIGFPGEHGVAAETIRMVETQRSGSRQDGKDAGTGRTGKSQQKSNLNPISTRTPLSNSLLQHKFRLILISHTRKKQPSILLQKN